MKRIAISVLTITVVALVGVAVTRAFFSDTETSENNTITAGSIDISVNGDNPWSESQPGEISDMKPSYVRWTKNVVKNVGTNPIKLWKHIKNVSTDNNGWSESECSDAGGTWDGNKGCDGPTSNQNNIDEFIEYDMYIGGNVSGNSGNSWLGGQHTDGTMIISEDDGITVSDIESVFVYLGTLNPGHSMKVWQSYHMKDETGNWAQTDKLTYTIEFYAEQVNGNGPTSTSLLLENKDTGGDWSPIIGDGTWGILKWAGNGPTFDFSSTLKAYGLEANTGYSLIYYADPYPGNYPGALLGSGNSNVSGDLTISANLNLGIDMPDPADANYPDGAKIWLVKSDDYNGSNAMTDWNPSEYLFEYNLIKYDDTDN